MTTKEERSTQYDHVITVDAGSESSNLIYSCLLYTSTLIFIPVFLGTFCGLYLNGKSFVWQGDGFRQYYPALQYLGRYYRTVISGMLHLDFSIPVSYTHLLQMVIISEEEITSI